MIKTDLKFKLTKDEYEQVKGAIDESLTIEGIAAVVIDENLAGHVEVTIKSHTLSAAVQAVCNLRAKVTE